MKELKEIHANRKTVPSAKVEHRSDASRSDALGDPDFERRILLALVEAQAFWIVSPDRSALRRSLIALLAGLEDQI